MTQPPSPGAMARVDQAHADASRFIDEMLTTGVSELQSGMPLHRLFVRYGAGLQKLLGAQGLDEVAAQVQLQVLLAVAVSRLARMHHAVEQLADQWTEQAPNQSVWDGNCEAAFERHAAALRKLVDDHG